MQKAPCRFNRPACLGRPRHRAPDRRGDDPHWTGHPYHWPINDGAAVFVVRNGAADRPFREAAGARVLHLATGDIFYVDRLRT